MLAPTVGSPIDILDLDATRKPEFSKLPNAILKICVYELNFILNLQLINYET